MPCDEENNRLKTWAATAATNRSALQRRQVVFIHRLQTSSPIIFIVWFKGGRRHPMPGTLMSMTTP